MDHTSSDQNSSVLEENTPESASGRVIQCIRQMINSGEILPGERFPSERNLAQRFHASRNTVREALHYYETLGMVKCIVGSGSYLIDDPDTLYKTVRTRQLLERYNWMEMIEMRQILEIGIVQLAAQRITREDKIKLRKINEAIRQASTIAKCSSDKSQYTKLDYKLHYEFARIARNSLLTEMFKTCRDTFMAAEQIWEMSAYDIDIADQCHQKIIDAIIDGDSRAAAREMREHLKNMSDMVIAAQNKSNQMQLERNNTDNAPEG